MPDVLDDLRRYGAAVEAEAARHASSPDAGPASLGAPRLTDYPVTAHSAPATIESVGRAGGATPSPRRRRTLVAAALVAVLVVATAVVVARRSDDTGGVVDTPPATEPVPTTEPFADGTVLMWLPYEEPPQYLAQRADRPAPLEIGDPPQPGRGTIATVNTTAAFFVGGSLHLVDRLGVVTATGVAGDRVLAERASPAFYVYASGILSRYDLSPVPPDPSSLPQWTVPSGWELANDGVGVDVVGERVLVERIDWSSADHELAVWTLSTDEIRPIGQARWVVDVSTYLDGVPRVAWVDADCDPSSTGCGLVITNLDTMESRTVARPEHGVIGGGAFSDDGRHLAVFVAGQEQMGVNPSADLAVVDVATLELRVLPGTNVAVGEPYGSAAWTLDDGSVIFHGLSETHVVDITTGALRTLPWEVTYAMATIP